LTLLIFLPLFIEEYEDVISIERHPTKFNENKNKTKYKKIIKYTKPIILPRN